MKNNKIISKNNIKLNNNLLNIQTIFLKYNHSQYGDKLKYTQIINIVGVV